MKLLPIAYLLLFFLLAGACQKNKDDLTGDPDPVVFVRTNLYGEVTGPQGQPLSGITVQVGSSQTMTDEQGYYALSGINLDQKGGVVRFSGNGWFAISRVAVPIADAWTLLDARMSPRSLSGMVNATSGGIVAVAGASVRFPAQAFVDAQGQAWTGQVHVHATFLDPASPDMQRRMPGNLTAIREDGRHAVLATFGMLGVELETPTGAPLQLASGKKAVITIPLTAEYRNAAPATIPLWYFDQEKGKWIEEGEAQLDGSAYVGEVSHFSFWNVDFPFEAIRLCGTTIAENGTPLVGAQIRLTVLSGGGANFPPGALASAWSGADGSFCGFVPADAEFVLEVLSFCGEVIHAMNVGPFTADHDLGTMLIEWNDNLIQVNGWLEDCQGNALVSPSYAVIHVGNYKLFLPVQPDGSVSGTVMNCQLDVLTAQAIDVVNLKQGDVQTYPVAGGSTVDLGVLTACDDLQEYIIVDLDGEPEMVWTEVQGGIDSPLLTFAAFGPDSTICQIGVPLLAPGQASPDFVFVLLPDPVSGVVQASCYQSNCQGMTVTVSQIGGLGEPVQGSFSGTIEVPGQGPTSMNGSFRFIRDY